MWRQVIRSILLAGLAQTTASAGQNPSTQSSADPQQQLTITKNLTSMPLAFTENRGQWDDQVKFRANAGGATMWFTETGAYYQFTRSMPGDEPQAESVDPRRELDREPEQYESMTIKASFVGANSNPRVIGLEEMEYKCNYFIGNDPSEWHTNVPNYEAIVLEEVYAGIDLKYYGNGKQMEYDFIVAPEADFTQIQIEYEGAKSLSVNEAGELVVETDRGTVTELRPLVYQVEDGERQPLAGEYILLSNSSFGFQLPEGYNCELALVIDPILVYSTHLGGSSGDYGLGIAVDGFGNAYVTGRTYSTDFPTEGEYQTHQGGGNVFVTKLNSSGNALVYSTYLGGSGYDQGSDISVDGSGNAYITGETASSDFPTEGAYQADHGSGGYDTFVTKLNSTGNALVYSTYLGGNDWDYGFGIAVDGFGNAYVTGSTLSPDFPTEGEYQTDQGYVDAFVTKLNSTGNTLVYSTYLGGSDYDRGTDISVDGSGNAYITGSTSSTNFPTEGAYQTDQGFDDAFVTKLNSTGNALVYSTYLGGSDTDGGWGISVDGFGNAYITGITKSPDFPTEGEYQTFQSGEDAFVTKLNSTGNGLVYSTYLGGDDLDFGTCIAVDGSGNAYVTGYTESSDFPTEGEYQTDQGGRDAFVTKLNSSGNALVYSTYLGGSGYDRGSDISVDGSGNAYITGITKSPDFPTEGAYQTNQGSWNAFVTKHNDEVGPPLDDPGTFCFTFRPPGSVFGGDAIIWGTTGFFNNHLEPPIVEGYLSGGRTYCFPLPYAADGLEFEVNWQASCGNVDHTVVMAARWEDGQWRLRNFGLWLLLWAGKASVEIEVPTLGDSSGTIQHVYTAVNLTEWMTDQQPLQDEYTFVDGTCPNLPGYVVSTTPIEFDWLAGPEESPFVITPLTGTLVRDGSAGLSPSGYSCCTGRVGDANNSGEDDPTIGDVAHLVDHLFIDKPELVCVAEADINQSGGIDPSQEEPGSDITIGDVANLVDYLFITGPELGGLPDCL